MVVVVWLGIAALMLLIWLAYLKMGNAAIIDVFWSMGITLAALAFFAIKGHFNQRSLLILLLLIIWASRLSAFLYWTRIRKKHSDQRYQTLSHNWRHPAWGFLLNYQLQGVLMVIMALPFLWSTQILTWHSIDIVGMLLVIAGIVGESIADYQLLCFKQSANRSGVMQQGLWRYSRHPNYFFECVVWFGFAILALPAQRGWLGLVAPLLLLLIMLGITLPMTEKQSLQSKGQAFRDYQRRTSAFIPWWPKL